MSATSLFGEHLKREREMRGVSLEEISAATRISVRFLEALENEQWERLPGGIFNRGFIRSVARFLGIDEDGLVAEYALETHERPEIAVWTKEPVRKKPNWAAIGSAIAVVILLIVGVWYVHERYGAEISAWHEEHPILKTLAARFHRSKAVSSSTMPSNTPADSSSAAAAITEKQKQTAPAPPVPAQPNSSRIASAAVAAPAATNPVATPKTAPGSG